MVSCESGYRWPVDSFSPAVRSDGSSIVVTLPNWLDEIIFQKLGGVHQPAGKTHSFDSNLHSSRQDVLTYLGTYFPRSLAESYVIFSSLLSDARYASLLSDSERLRICSLGTGTGGDLVGLILALRGRMVSCPKLEITSAEGNQVAHRIMETILSKTLDRVGFSASIKSLDYVFEPPKPFQSFVTTSGVTGPFDFVISSKMLNELASAHVCARPYYEFCETFAEQLSPNGVLLSLDITSMVDSKRSWAPSLLNGQMNAFLKDNRDFASILPLLCNRFEESCARDCYTQNTVCVSHSKKQNECSKICYRVIGHRDFVDRLANSPALWDCPITSNNKTHCVQFLQA